MIKPELADLIVRVAKAQAAVNDACDSALEAKHLHDQAMDRRAEATEKLHSLQMELGKALGARY